MDYELEDLKYAAKYPFTKIAKEIITGGEVSIDYEVMERAARRAGNGIIYENIPMLETHDRGLLNRELLSYPIARMIVSLIGNRYIGRYINSEVKRAVRYLQDSDTDREKVAKEFGISLKGNRIDAESYLKFIPKTKEYSLVNQDFSEGTIALDQLGIMAVISEAMRQSIQAGLPVKKESIPKELAKDIEEAAGKLHGEINQSNISIEKVGKVEMGGEIAPCIKRLLDLLKNGENVPHMGRWVMAAYLLKKGFSVDEIVNLFSGAPNFNEKITRYQVEYIKKKEYGVPSCMNLDSYGICIERCGVGHPFRYGLKRSAGGTGRKYSSKYQKK